MKKIVCLILLVFATGLMFVQTADAQCSMCTINAEQGAKSGNTQTKGINDGVLFLLATPFVLIAGVGSLWYFKYHKEQPVA
jgi:UPF0716 family protein affecting phage T7 exclusion